MHYKGGYFFDIGVVDLEKFDHIVGNRITICFRHGSYLETFILELLMIINFFQIIRKLEIRIRVMSDVEKLMYLMMSFKNTKNVRNKYFHELYLSSILNS